MLTEVDVEKQGNDGIFLRASEKASNSKCYSPMISELTSGLSELT